MYHYYDDQIEIKENEIDKIPMNTIKIIVPFLLILIILIGILIYCKCKNIKLIQYMHLTSSTRSSPSSIPLQLSTNSSNLTSLQLTSEKSTYGQIRGETKQSLNEFSSMTVSSGRGNRELVPRTIGRDITNFI